MNENLEPVEDYQEAMFIINHAPERRPQLIRDGDKLYLLQPGQQWDTIKNSQESKAEARQQFKLNRLELMTAPSLVQRNKDKTISNANRQIEDIQLRLEKNKQLSVEMKHNMTVLKEARQQLNLQMTPKPTPADRLNVAPQPTPAAVILSYKQQIQFLRQQTQIMPRDLYTLAAKAPEHTQPSIGNYLELRLKNKEKHTRLSEKQGAEILQDMQYLGSMPEEESHYKSPTPFAKPY